MAQMNFSWVLDGTLAGAEGPARVRDLLYLKQQGILAIVRMEAQTISGERGDLIDLYEPVADFTPPNLSKIQRMVLFIQEQIETWQRPVAVTCYAGTKPKVNIAAIEGGWPWRGARTPDTV